MIEDSPPLLTIAQAARRLRRDRKTIYRWIAAGDLRATRMNGRNYIADAEIERLRRGEQP